MSLGHLMIINGDIYNVILLNLIFNGRISFPLSSFFPKEHFEILFQPISKLSFMLTGLLVFSSLRLFQGPFCLFIGTVGMALFCFVLFSKS